MFQHIIGALSWLFELEKMDIMTEVSCFSQHFRSPCEGHLNSVYNIFKYLQKNLSKNKLRIAFYPAFVHTDYKVSKVSTREL